MTKIRRLPTAGLMIFCLLLPTLSWSADDCSQQLAHLEQQNRELHLQLREARRELALERNREQEPGWPQVIGGIGLIFGLCGVGMMIGARKRQQ